MRADAAECLYVVLQSRDLGATDAAEDVLLETEWCVLPLPPAGVLLTRACRSASDAGAVRAQAETVARLLAEG